MIFKRRKPAAQRKTSDKAVHFIASFEGFRSLPYNDPAGHATIGYGHLLHLGPVTAFDKKRYPHGISQPAAFKLLRKDIVRYADAVRANVKVKLYQHEFDALVSFAFNVGIGAFRSSTLLRHLNRGDYNSVPKQLQRWVHGRVIPGLVRRRKAEALMFSKGKYK
jgi:lysozyme